MFVDFRMQIVILNVKGFKGSTYVINCWRYDDSLYFSDMFLGLTFVAISQLVF